MARGRRGRRGGGLPGHDEELVAVEGASAAVRAQWDNGLDSHADLRVSHSDDLFALKRVPVFENEAHVVRHQAKAVGVGVLSAGRERQEEEDREQEGG